MPRKTPERKAAAGSRPTRQAAPVATMRKQGDKRWSELVELSAQIFAERGYSETSIQEISDRLGILKGSLYYYIKSKDDLLYEVIRSVFQPGYELVRSIADRPGPGLERLSEAIHGHTCYLLEHLTYTTVYLNDFKHLDTERKKELAPQRYDDVFEGLIRRGIEDGSMRTDVDPHIAAMAVLGAVNAIRGWHGPSNGITAEAIATTYTDLFVSALRPSAVSLKAGDGA